MAIIVKPPTPIPTDTGLRRVFLAGSIDLGEAPDWQQELGHSLLEVPRLAILNPRRDKWDNSWGQSVEDPRFCGQVEWELEGLEVADLIVFYFAPGTKSPVTMLELGLHARQAKAIVCCPEGFWRKGNVDIVCTRYGVEQTHDLGTLTEVIRQRFLLEDRGPANDVPQS